jgi:type I restriction enzyme S subunit
MKKGWQTKKLGDVAEISAGNSAPQDESLFEGGTYPFFRTADAGRIRFGDIYESTDYLNEKGIQGLRRFPKGTILFPKSGASTFLNHRVMLGVEGCVASHLATIVADETQIKPRFLLYFLSIVAAQDLVQDHAYPSLNLPAIGGISIQAPPLAEQERIVGLLDAAFAGLATAQAHAATNLQNARALFASHLQSVFSQPGKGWVKTTVDKISTNLDSKRVPITKNVRTSGKYPYYGASGIVDYVADYIFEGDTLLVSEDGANLLARSTPIAFSVSGKYWVNNHAHILKFENTATQRFVEFYLGSIKLDEYIRGAAQPKLSQTALNSIPIPIPKSVEAQARVVESIESLSEETQRLESIYQRKLAALAELKKALLHRAFAGEL